VLERGGKVAISRCLAQDAIDAIEHLYNPGDEWPTLQPMMRDCSAFVATRLKRATGQEKLPMRDGPGTDI
jgi:hypothetical protein